LKPPSLGFKTVALATGNVFPLLRPCLSNVYDKMAGKASPFKRFRPNNAVRSDLAWASDHLARASGILALEHLSFSYGAGHHHRLQTLTQRPYRAEIPSYNGNCESNCQLTNSSYNDILFNTMLAVGFHSLLCLGDLTDPPNPANISPAKRASRLSIKSHHDSISYVLPAHKADKFFKGTTILVKNLWPQIDVVRLFSIYLKTRDSRHLFLLRYGLRKTGLFPIATSS
ncbi:hypothetical protein BJ165DRAFT_1553705, partial [Panaeolus papilionaceus]